MVSPTKPKLVLDYYTTTCYLLLLLLFVFAVFVLHFTFYCIFYGTVSRIQYHVVTVIIVLAKLILVDAYSITNAATIERPTR